MFKNRITYAYSKYGFLLILEVSVTALLKEILIHGLVFYDPAHNAQLEK